MQAENCPHVAGNEAKNLRQAEPQQLIFLPALHAVSMLLPEISQHAQNGPVEPLQSDLRIRYCPQCWMAKKQSQIPLKNDAARPHTIMMNVGMPSFSEANNPTARKFQAQH